VPARGVPRPDRAAAAPRLPQVWNAKFGLHFPWRFEGGCSSAPRCAPRRSRRAWTPCSARALLTMPRPRRRRRSPCSSPTRGRRRRPAARARARARPPGRGQTSPPPARGLEVPEALAADKKSLLGWSLMVSATSSTARGAPGLAADAAGPRCSRGDLESGAVRPRRGLGPARARARRRDPPPGAGQEDNPSSTRCSSGASSPRGARGAGPRPLIPAALGDRRTCARTRASRPWPRWPWRRRTHARARAARGHMIALDVWVSMTRTWGAPSASRGARDVIVHRLERLGLGTWRGSSPTSTRSTRSSCAACGCPRRVGADSVEVLADRYEVVNEIARGGMGRVVRARDRPRPRGGDQAALARGAGRRGSWRASSRSRRSRASSAPGIVPVHDLGVHGDDHRSRHELVRAARSGPGEGAGGRGRRRHQAPPSPPRAAVLGRRLDPGARRPRVLRLFSSVRAVAFAHARGRHPPRPQAGQRHDRQGDEVLVVTGAWRSPGGRPVRNRARVGAQHVRSSCSTPRSTRASTGAPRRPSPPT